MMVEEVDEEEEERERGGTLSMVNQGEESKDREKRNQDDIFSKTELCGRG